MKKGLIVIALLLVLPATVTAQDKKKVAKPADNDAKVLGGMSIMGNNEAPKALYIVPWKSSELGMETGLNANLDGSMKPVDKEVFMREVGFYELSKTN